MIYANARRSHKFIVACRLNLLDEADDAQSYGWNLQRLRHSLAK